MYSWMNALLSRSRSCSPPPPLNPWHEAVHFSCRFSESLSLSLVYSLPKALARSVLLIRPRLARLSTFLSSFLPPTASAAKHCSH